MITQISKLKNFGIFSDFNCTPTTLREFKKFNLVYGWNGSGKSTLTKIFACLEKKKLHEDFPTVDFSINVVDDVTINTGNLEQHNLNIRVFNDDFVTDNIRWDNDKTAKSILILSEEKIEEKKKFEDLRIKLSQKITEQTNKQITLDAEEKIKENFLSATAKTVKEAFKIIDTSDTHYFNYSRPKLDTFVNGNETNLKSTSAILNNKELDLLTRSIRPTSKALLTFELDDLKEDQLLLAESRIKTLIQTNIFNTSILRLKEHPEIQDWVRRGVEIHEQNKSTFCEFCGEKISANRKDALNQHFNDEYIAFIMKVDNALSWIDNAQILVVDLPDASELYDELQADFLAEKSAYQTELDELPPLFHQWKVLLLEKKTNPFLNHLWEIAKINKHIDALNGTIKRINIIKHKHNTKTQNFDKELSSLKTKLETHYAASAVKDAKFFNLVEGISLKKAELVTIDREISTVKKEINIIEKELTDEIKGAVQFNDMLHVFLGRDDISLHFVEAEKGYKILRKGSAARARNLSEGEKTAIAFIYFVIKLGENGNNIEETVVIVDDPVSSLDSNHLIHAYAFLKNQCSNVKQLFVLTHNFHFFKLIRDWMFYISPANGDKNYYTINTFSKNGLRQSELANANNFLIKYNSEYHYLFFKLNEFDRQPVIDIEEMYVVANLGRRFIESLITFKYPKKTKDIWEKFQKVVFDETEKTKVYKFINLFSHNDKIESHETFGDNLFSEGKALVSSTLSFIKAIDEDHYNELLSIYNN